MRVFQTVIALLLFAAFTVATTGVVIASHYCGGELDSVSLVAEQACACSMEHDEEPCCTHTIAVLKLQPDAPNTSSLTIDNPLPCLWASGRDSGVAAAHYTTPVQRWAVVAPSPPYAVDIPIRCCTLLI